MALHQPLPARPTAAGAAAPQPGRAPGGPLTRVSFRALGTECLLQYVAPEEETGRRFAAAARAWVEAFESKYSRFRPDSLISRINQAAGRAWVEIDPEAEALFQMADAIVHLTRGALDPTVLPLLRLWDYRRPQPTVPSPAQVRETLTRVGWAKVQRAPGRILLPEPGMALDLGGFGKEYAVDQVAELALAQGIRDVLVDFGHDLRACGQAGPRTPWFVGLEDPARAGQAWAGIALENQGLAASGNYQRGFTAGGRRYGHILDPRTGYPAQGGIDCVYVTAATCLEAGLLSTTACLLGPEEALALIDSTFGADGCLVAGKSRYYSRDFAARLVPTTS